MLDRPGVAVGAGDVVRHHHRRRQTTGDPREADLLAQVRAGDTEAFGELYELHRSDVERLARRLSRDRYEADDVTSEVFCNTLRALRSGSGPQDGCREYLLRAVRHTVIKRHTRKDTGRAVACPTEDLDRAGRDEVGELGGAATEAFCSVSEKFQDLLWFVEVEGHDSADVADQEHIAKPAAQSLLYRARRSLRRAYVGGAARTVPMHDASCGPIRGLMPGFVDGDDATPSAERIRRHVTDCVECGEALDRMSAVQGRIEHRGLLLLLPGALRAVVADGAHSLTAVLGGTSSMVAAATLTVGAVALPSATGPTEAAGVAWSSTPAPVDDDRRSGPTGTATSTTATRPTPRPTTPVDRAGAVTSPAPGTVEPPTPSATAGSTPIGPVPTVPALPTDPIVDDGIEDLGNTLDETLGGIADDTIDSIERVAGQATGTVSEVVDDLGATIDGVVDAVTGDGGVVEGTLGTVPVVQDVDEIVDGATDGLDDLVDDVIVGAVDGVFDGLGGLGLGTP